ncbi:MAG TPA: acetylornithine deacetylase [Acidobacteriaceae bacterium]|nr:acetylornithine deacetylase [Acidobacteriaceae bacterium]
MPEDLSPASLLLELIRIPSVSSLPNRPLVDFIRSVLQPRGWHLRELPYTDAAGSEKLNIIAIPPAQPADKFSVDLAFVCHTDTVPYDAGWSEATNPEIRDGQIHGSGACDVKGFLACLLAAFAPIPADRNASTMALVFTAEEEIGCVGARKLIDADLLRARHLVIGEPTSLRPARAGKGYGLANIRVRGKQAHSAFPAQGRSAIYNAARLIVKIEQFSDSLKHSAGNQTSGLFDPPYTTLNVGTIHGGTAKNVVSGECCFLLEWRSLPGEPAGTIPDRLEKIMDEIRHKDPEFTCETQVIRQQPGFHTSETSPLLRRWIEVAGLDSIGVPFGTEAPLLGKIAQDVIVVGPGDMRTAHSERECVPVAELERCVGYLRGLFLGIQ